MSVVLVDGEPQEVLAQFCDCPDPKFLARGEQCVQIGSPPTAYAKATLWICQECGGKVLSVDEEFVEPPPDSLFGGEA